MKTISIFLFALAGAILIGGAQTNEADATKTHPVPPPKRSDYIVTYQTNVPYSRRLGEMQVTYGGVIHEMRAGGTRRLMVSADPASPAYPFQNVSVHPRTGRAEGIILFSINF